MNADNPDAVRFHCKPFADLTVQELDALYRLRQEVFVVEQDCPYPDADGVDAQCWHLWATDDASAEVVAVARLVPAGVKYSEGSIGRVAVRQRLRGAGVGRRLMAYALAQAELYGMAESGVRIGAQAYLQGFYESLGFVAVSETYLEDGITHVEMFRKYG